MNFVFVSRSSFDVRQNLPGAKIAVSNGVLADYEDAFGPQLFSPVLVAFSETYLSIITGAIDGALFSMDSIDLVRLAFGDDLALTEHRISGEFYNLQFGTDNPDILTGSGLNDAIDGGLSKDEITGGNGKDELRGGKGNDELNGGKGQDVLKGGKGNDILKGGQGKDELFAGDGNDKVFGNKGADKLFVSKGNDEYTGGDGADTFLFDKASQFIGRSDSNTILDFEKGSDLIDLSGVDANTNTEANDAFTFIGSAGLSGTAGELRATQKANGDWLINGDVDGDGNRDFQIKIDDFGGLLDVSDFVL